MMPGRDKKVIVGMSGGVDSSVAAALLKKQGFRVVGVYLRFWKEKNENQKNKRAISDAKGVCKILDIPLKIVDARKEFRNSVIKYFLDEYSSGKTPNPCIFCNENIKFKILLEILGKLKADYVATGHYARIVERGTRNMKRKKYFLFQAKDERKDQSYFLYRLKQGQLSKILFPLGDYTKPEVRQIAKKLDLPVFEKSDSQDICFLEDKDTQRFLEKYLKIKKGKIIDSDGKVVGEHQGLPLYTIGQRRGVNIGGNGPYYAVAKDLKNNILRVTNNPKELKLFSDFFEIKNANWIGKEPKFPLKALIKTRYRQEMSHGIIKKKNKNIFQVQLEKKERAVTPGQSAVFYAKSGEVLGGGIIK